MVKTGPARLQEQHPGVPAGPAQQPRSRQFVWVQNAARQPPAQSCQPAAAALPAPQLGLRPHQLCSHHVLLRDRSRTNWGFSLPRVTFQWRRQVLGPRAPGKPEELHDLSSEITTACGEQQRLLSNLHSLKPG